MHIVVEGPDGTGKSTLINRLHELIPHYLIVRGRGPEKHPGEINERVNEYLNMDHNFVIFDRHPCISQEIYSPVVGMGTLVDKQLIEKFYKSNPFFIYCRSTGDHLLENHDATHEGDTEEYLERLNKNYGVICSRYDQWAINHAHIVKHKMEDANQVLDMMKGIV